MLKVAKTVKTRCLEREAYERLARTLREVPFLRDSSFRYRTPRAESGADFVLAISGRGVTRRLVCLGKSSGQPRLAREACLTLLEMLRSDSRAYPVFAAPYISPQAASICESYNVGYLDFAGNCRLTFDRVYIRREGYPNPRVQRRDLRSLYSPKAERVLRVLLTAGSRAWRTQELADEAGVSLGQVANVKKLLSNREWIKTAAHSSGIGFADGSGYGFGSYGIGFADGSGYGDPFATVPAGFALRSFEDAVSPLLQEWAANYRPSRNTPVDFYSPKAIPQVEAELVAASRETKTRFGLTGFSGGARLAPAVRYQRVTAYVAGDIEAVADRLGLKQVPSGANVTLIAPYDEGVFYGLREIEDAPVVSPVQLYLDLKQTKGRGEEAANAILQEIIEPLWR